MSKPACSRSSACSSGIITSLQHNTCLGSLTHQERIHFSHKYYYADQREAKSYNVLTNILTVHFCSLSIPFNINKPYNTNFRTDQPKLISTYKNTLSIGNSSNLHSLDYVSRTSNPGSCHHHCNQTAFFLSEDLLRML